MLILEAPLILRVLGRAIQLIPALAPNRNLVTARLVELLPVIVVAVLAPGRSTAPVVDK